MPEAPIVFPFGGVSDDLAHEKQPQATTRRAKNVRGIDPRTGRTRGAQRAGTERLVDAQVSGGNAIKRLGKVTYAQSTVTYTVPASGTGAGQIEDPAGPNPLVAVRTPTQAPDVFHVLHDLQSNVYALDGRARVVKYNSAGELVCSVSLDLDDEYLTARALEVSPLGDFLWVGVSGISVSSEYAGGRQKLARIYAFKAMEEEDGYELLWELKPVDVLTGHEEDTGRGAYTEEIHLRAGKLWTVQNEPDLNRAFVRVYGFPTSETPELSAEWPCPFPAHGFDVGADNDSFVASKANPVRGIDPRAPDTTAQTVDWAPEDLPFWERRAWAWVKAEDIDGFGNSTLEDGDEVTLWRDLTGNQRNLVVWDGDSLGTTEGPRFRAVGSTGRPSVQFDQSGAANQALQGIAQTSTLATAAEIQRTFLPGYDGHMYALFLVVRVPAATPRTFLCGYNRTGDTAAQALVMNAATGASAADPTTSDLTGFVSRVDRLVSGGLAAASPSDFMIEGQYDTTAGVSTGDFAVIGVTCANAQNADGLTPSQSVFWVNGQAIDRVVDDAAQTSDGIFWLGREFDSGGGYPATGGGPLTGEIMEILVLRDYTDDAGAKHLIQVPDYPDGAWDGINAETEFDRVMGYLMHKYGLAHNAPRGAASATNFPFPFYIQTTATTAGGPPRLSGVGTASVFAQMNDVSPVLAKFDSSGDPKWCIVGEPDPTAGANAGVGGLGYGVRVSPRTGAVWSIGPRAILSQDTAATAAEELQMNAVVRKIQDEGDAYDLTVGVGIDPETGTWQDGWGTVGAREDPEYEWPRMDVGTGQADDRDFDVLSVPVYNSTITQAVYTYNEGGQTAERDPSSSFGLPDGQEGYAVSVDPNAPVYLPKSLGVTTPEKLAVGSDSADRTEDTLFVYLLVNQAQNSNQPRVQRVLAVSNGDVRVRSGASWAAPSGSLALDPTARWVDFVEAFGKGYLTDGRNDLVYTPDVGVNGQLARWRSESSGRMPEGFLLLALWNGRVMRGRSLSDPQNWAASEQGNPLGWNFLPAVFDPRQAFIGNDSQTGRCPDAITGLCPIDNDLLVVGCDHTLQLLRGDPGIGGRFDLISDITGMAFGRAWCKDPNGALWFFGSQGGLYYMPPLGLPQRVTLRTIEQRLRDVDLDANYVELAWNQRHEGLHVFIIPKSGSAGEAVITQFFFDVKNGIQAPAPWPDEFPVGKQITCAYLIDGDEPDDRTLLLGCEDGRVRVFSDAALSDDAGSDDDPIMSEVLIGPLALPDSSYKWRARRPTINIAGDQGPARADFYVSDQPDVELSVPLETVTLHPGRNPRLPMHLSGPLIWVALSNYAVGQSWAYEGGNVEVVRGGRVTA